MISQSLEAAEFEIISVRDNNLIGQLEIDLTEARKEITRLSRLVAAYNTELKTWENIGQEFSKSQSKLLDERNTARRECEEQRERAEEAEESREN
jgi:hypothetical protein